GAVEGKAGDRGSRRRHPAADHPQVLGHPHAHHRGHRLLDQAAAERSGFRTPPGRKRARARAVELPPHAPPARLPPALPVPRPAGGEPGPVPGCERAVCRLGGGPAPSARAYLARSIASSSRRRAPSTSVSGRRRSRPTSAAAYGTTPFGTSSRPKRSSIQLSTAARATSSSGACVTPGTRTRNSRPPGTRRNLPTEPARAGTVPGVPAPSARWQPWQVTAQSSAGPLVPSAAATADTSTRSATAVRHAARPWLRPGRDTEDDGHRAVDRPALGAEAPQEVVVLHGEVERPLPLGARAPAAHAERLPAAVVVRDDVVLPVAGVAAGADPGEGRHLRPRRAGVLRAAAAGAEEAVDRAVPPVVAALRVAQLAVQRRVVGHRRVLVGRRARHRQQRQHRRPGKRRAEAREKAPTGGPARERARRPFAQAVEPASFVGHRCSAPLCSSAPRRKSWIDATPRSWASNRLSRCSRVFTSPRERTTPDVSSSTA